MRKAPNYIPGEAVDGKYKQDLLKYLGNHFQLKTIIETGSCDGGTLYPIHQRFEKCYTIELSEHYYQICKEKFKNAPNVTLIHGNSAIALRELLTKLPYQKVLFWLDAHSSGGLTANEGDPLAEEIRAIVDLSPESLIVIDDQKDGLLIQVPGQYLIGYRVEFRTGIVFLYKQGLYNIPEFE